ncbi:MAG: hypothetical protein AB7Q29_07265 [Vicinamibacterales bacterium]
MICHVEHAGADGELRPIDTKRFDHSAEAGFPLAGAHAKVAGTCTACHKSRSFLDLKPGCDTCHDDPHKGSLAGACATCHPPASPSFKTARTSFDHRTTRFPLTGAHRTAACEQCHTSGQDRSQFTGVAFASCTACHREPHERRLGAACTSCHTTQAWTTRTIAHERTRFPLAGAHTRVACEACHKRGRATIAIESRTCASCHDTPHRQSIEGDCASCHTERSFAGAPFDHAAKTTFALEGRHAEISCDKCHEGVSDRTVPLAKRTVDFSGATAACVSCHEARDPHQGSFGRACDTCHSQATFSVKDFRHPREPKFFAGAHQALTCTQCHIPSRAERPAPAALPSMQCVTCHADPHLGQLDPSCDQCHAIDGRGFEALAFSHERARLRLEGAHASIACSTCHVTQTTAFPAHTGTAVRFKPIEPACVTCHSDVHLGQLGATCAACHTASTFHVGGSYVHRELKDFFDGFHGRYACKDCHKPERGRFPSGEGVAVRYLVGRTCSACHPQY